MTEQQTHDREKKIAEIREALEKATQGPWKVKKGERWTEDYPIETYIQAVWDKPDHRGCVGYRVAKMSGVHDKTMRDAYLIANAPEWLRFLLSELERLEHEYALERAAHNAHVTELCELEQERDKLIEGLRWYAEADYDHKIMTDYYEDDGELFFGTELDLDRGQRARNILHEIGVTVDV